MTNVFALYFRLLKPWMTVVVYLWILEFLVCFSARDPEPLFDRIADCAAILATMVFWISVAVWLLWFVAIVLNRSLIGRANEYAAKAILVAITAFFFLRWIYTWTLIIGNPHAVSTTLVSLGLIMGVWVWRARSKGKGPSASECLLVEAWSYFVAPILVLVCLMLSVKVLGAIGLKEKAFANVAARRPNIVLVVADALRQQNMSLYGYHRKTTPFLDRFAAQSHVYTQMHVNSTSTRTSLTTILSGKHPLSHGRLTKFQPVYESSENVLAVLHNNGYTTAAVTSNVDATFYMLGLVKFLGFGEYPNFRRLTLSFLRDNGVYPTSPGMRMYDEFAQLFFYLGYPEKTLGYGPARDTVNLALRLVARLPEPFFLFVHFHDPHDPYEAPPPFRSKYAKLAPDEVNAKIPAGFYRRYEREMQPFVDAHRDQYDEAIEYLDSELEKLVSALDLSPKTRNTLIVLTSDHGESFERGFLNHGEPLYETSIHVPLVIRLPNQHHGERHSDPVQSTDIAPTLLDTVGLPVPRWMDGVAVSKAELLGGRGGIVVNYKEPANGKIYDLPTQLAILWHDYKLIQRCDDGSTELYDLSKDPDERMNLSVTKFDVAEELRVKLQHRLEEQTTRTKLACPAETATKRASNR